MNGRKWALTVCVAASCAGCVTESKSVPLTTEAMANVKGIKEAEFPKREAQPTTWVAIGELNETRAGDPKAGPVQQSASRDEARKAYQKALELDPKCATASIHLANIYLKQDDSEKALAVYQRAVQQNPKASQLWYEQGIVYCQRQNFKSAIESFAKAHQLDPESHLYASQYGLCLARANQPELAVKVLCKVMNKAEANYNVARMMIQIDKLDQGLQYLQATLAERPTHVEALRLQTALQGAAVGADPVASSTRVDGSLARVSWEASQ